MGSRSATSGIARQVRNLRQQRGWSARALAEACLTAGSRSLTRGTIAKIESGTRKSVTADELAVLAQVFGVSVDELISASVDPHLVQRLSAEVASALAGQRDQDDSNGLPRMSAADEREFAGSVIARVLDEHARAEIVAGRNPPTDEEKADLAQSVHDALFGLGRLQPLLDDPDVESIDINGFDHVFIQFSDGREDVGAPVADSDDELVDLVRVLIAHSGPAGRSFDSANPEVELRLPDGTRLSAVLDVSDRPAVSIRRARLERITLEDLLIMDSLTAESAGFLSAAVAARKNIIIAGAAGAGKTTLLRALANEVPPYERLITVEPTFELGLGALPQLHPNVVALEERRPNSEGLGAISMDRLVRRAHRMNPSRIIVGEVRGDEIVTMLNAMSQGNDGSLSTIHANRPAEVFTRIATYAIQSAERLPIEATHMLIAEAIDFVVFLERRSGNTGPVGRARRFVSSIREIDGFDGRVISREIFTPGPNGAAVAAAPISSLDDLVEAGYRPGSYERARHPESGVVR